MILLRSLPADCAEGIGYVSRTVMFEGVYPDRIRCRAVDEPIVPPPPTTTVFMFARDDAILSQSWSDYLLDLYYSTSGKYLFHRGMP